MKNIFIFGRSTLFVLYAVNFVFTLASSLPTYVSSSFLAGLTSEQATGFIYAICSVLTLIALVFTPYLFRRFGNYRLTLYLSVITFISFFGIAFSGNASVIIVCFIANWVVTTIMSLCLDLFVEHNSLDENTGKIRSLYLTAGNLAWLASPWISGLLVGTDAYWKVFLAATAVMIPATLLISYNLKGFKDPEYEDLKFFKTIRSVWQNRNMRCIFAASFLLSFFFAWMTIYTPIYLNRYVGFSWVQIGLIFTIMLLPFIFIQAPAGAFADKKYGEKEMLSIGFVIMAISAALIPFIGGKNFWVWALLLFATRIGASIVQVMTDTYFFKNIGEKNVSTITLYRFMFPLAYVVAPLIAVLFLLYFSISSIFFALGFLMLFGLRYSVAIQDTK